MIRLFGAELNRLFSRRITVLMLVGVVLAVGAFQIFVNSQIQPPSAAEIAEAQSQLDQNRTIQEEYVQECRAQSGTAEECGTVEAGELSDYLYQMPFVDTVKLSLNLSIYLVALGTFMVAGSYIGAEYASGSISNWLTFIPQRGKVFLSKLITIGIFGAAVSLLGSAIALAVPLVLAAVYDVKTEQVADLVAMGARGILIGVVLGVLGFCIGLVSRHTAAAVGVLLGYLFVMFVRRGLLGGIDWAQRLTPWTPEGNIGAIVEKKYLYEVMVRTTSSEGAGYDFVEKTISRAHGLTFWGIVLLVVIAGSLLIFRRRDVS